VRHRSLILYVIVLIGCAATALLLGWGLAIITKDDISLGITAVATAGLFGATVLLAWRVPASADSLANQLSEATEQLADVQAHRDALIEVLSREPLYAETIPRGERGGMSASEPTMGGMVAPLLIVDMPRGRLPQRVSLHKEECQKWLAEIERAEGAGGGTAVLEFSNCTLVLAVPEDRSHGAYFSRYAKTGTTAGSPILAECAGFVELFESIYREIKTVARHDLPSFKEMKQRVELSQTSQ